ncbi:MAG: ABC transporter ATP-binding protein [Bacteroidia bacterium]|nr:ABC transporter ATP-binding protein [Bacteroidia bacterium]
MEKVIEVRGLSKSFGDHKAVDGLDLDVYRGDVFGFLGPNGAGKSTSIRMLLSLIRPDRGSVKIFNQEINQNRSSILSRIGCIIEKPDFYRYLNAVKNLQLLATYSGISLKRSKAEELLEFVGLKGRGDELVKGYSHGMKQRLGLAQALVHDPELIILDEPTTGLDPQGIIDMRNLIVYLSRERGKTVFLSSHILYELELVANRMAILNKGKLVVQGEKSVLLNEQERVVEIQVDRPSDALVFLNSLSWREKIELHGEIISIHTSKQRIPELVSVVSEAGFLIYAVESRRMLEDLFLKLTESADRMQVK